MELAGDEQTSQNGDAERAAAGTSLVVQWLRHRDSHAVGAGSDPGQETKIPHDS